MTKTILAIIVFAQISFFMPGAAFAQPRGPVPGPDPQPWEGQTVPGQLGHPTRKPVNTGQEVTNERIRQTSGSKNLASECSALELKSLIDILVWLKCIAVSVLIPLIFAAAFVIFLWGVLRFMYATEKTKRDEAKKLVWWGLIGLFVMVSVWGIIEIAGTTLGINPVAVPLLDTSYLEGN